MSLTLKSHRFGVGAYVQKNSETWVANDFDSWGRGQGIGQVVEPPFDLPVGEVDVRWPAGRCFEATMQLIPASPPDDHDA